MVNIRLTQLYSKLLLNISTWYQSLGLVLLQWFSCFSVMVEESARCEKNVMINGCCYTPKSICKEGNKKTGLIVHKLGVPVHLLFSLLASIPMYYLLCIYWTCILNCLLSSNMIFFVQNYIYLGMYLANTIYNTALHYTVQSNLAIWT